MTRAHEPLRFLRDCIDWTQMCVWDQALQYISLWRLLPEHLYIDSWWFHGPPQTRLVHIRHPYRTGTVQPKLWDPMVLHKSDSSRTILTHLWAGISFWYSIKTVQCVKAQNTSTLQLALSWMWRVDVPAGLRALLFIACAVTEGSREGGTQVIRVGFIINGTEDQTGLVT